MPSRPSSNPAARRTIFPGKRSPSCTGPRMSFAAVCHAPAVLHRVMYKGAPIVKGKRVTGFTNGEEEAIHLTNVVPFLAEDELKRLGGLYEKAADWESFAIVDGRLVTGQNPASSTAAAKALMELLTSQGDCNES